METRNEPSCADSTPQPDQQGMPACGKVLAGVAIFVSAMPFVAEAWFVVTVSRRTLMASMPDDAFYYLEIGQRAARGEGFTFDGIHATSGYHPLWQWIVSATEWIVGNETGQVRAIRLLSLVMVAAAFAIVCRVVWRSAGAAPALGGLLVASHSTAALQTWASGMETPAVVLSLALCFWALHSYLVTPTRRGAALVGLASAALVLARLDMIAVVPILGLVVAARPPRLRNVAGWLAGAATIGVPYALYHLAANGSLLTTSATVKRYWVADHVETLGGFLSSGHRAELAELVRAYVESLRDQIVRGPFAALSTMAGATLVILACWGAAVGARRMRTEDGRIGPLGLATATMAAAAAVKLAVDLLVVPLWVLSWYASVGQTTVAWMVGAAAGAGLIDVSRRLSRNAFVPLAALVAVALVPSGLSVATDGSKVLIWQNEIDQAASWLLENRPPGSYGAFDAGLLGYRLDAVRSVENLDGLVNDREFSRFLAERPSRAEVVEREGIDILVNDLPVDERRTTWACATTLWEGTASVSSTRRPNGDRVYVLDLSGCR